MNTLIKQIRASWHFMGGGIPGYAAIIWTLSSVILVITVLLAVFEIRVSSSGSLQLLLGGEVEITPGSIAMILSIPYYILLLVAIQQTADKTDMLMNQVLNEMLASSDIHRVWIYSGAFVARLLMLGIMLLIIWTIYNLLFLLIFGIIVSGIAALAGILVILFSLLVLYDVCFVTSGSSGKANSFVTILLVVMVIMSTMIASVPGGNIEWVNHWFIPDLLLRIYLVAEADLGGNLLINLTKIIPFISGLLILNFMLVQPARQRS